MSMVESSEKCSDGVVAVNQGISSGDFMRNLKGFLGLVMPLFESESCSKKSRFPNLDVLENLGEWVQKKTKTTPRISASSIDVSMFDADEVSAAITLLMLKEEKINPGIITGKEEEMPRLAPHSSSQDSNSGEEKTFKKQAISSMIIPKKKIEDSVDGEVRPAKRVKKISHYSYLQNPEEPDLPMNFKIRIRELTGSEEAVFIYEKKLYKSDVNSGQNRLLIPFKKLKNDFLTEEEKRKLKTDDKIEGKQAIKALLIDPSLEECNINLKEWDMCDKSTGKFNENYVLVTSWSKVVENNKLAEGMKVQLWSFRRDGELCFALVNRGNSSSY